MTALNNFIDTVTDAREMKRAIAVKLRKEGRSIKETARTLNVSEGYVVKWRGVYKKEGTNGLKLRYKGGRSYLDEVQKEGVVDWLKERSSWDLTELYNHLEETYGVIYKSKQSYYDLFRAAGLSWKKAQKKNPKKDPAKVAAKKEELKGQFKVWRQDILTGELAIFLVDECHLI